MEERDGEGGGLAERRRRMKDFFLLHERGGGGRRGQPRKELLQEAVDLRQRICKGKDLAMGEREREKDFTFLLPGIYVLPSAQRILILPTSA